MSGSITAIGIEDHYDRGDASVEIHEGMGGEDAALFAEDLFNMYCNYARMRGWAVQVVSQTPGKPAGIREVIFRVQGDGAYKRLRHETGKHRVTRTPARGPERAIHTSTASVIVMPSPGEDARTEVMRSYNIPRDSVTDHRTKFFINGVSNVLSGDLDALIDGIQDRD